MSPPPMTSEPCFSSDNDQGYRGGLSTASDYHNTFILFRLCWSLLYDGCLMNEYLANNTYFKPVIKGKHIAVTGHLL